MENWTSEEFSLMAERLAERKKREADAIRGKIPSNDKVSATELFSRMGSQVKVIKNLGRSNSKVELYLPKG
jgi:hypothetical protein